METLAGLGKLLKIWPSGSYSAFTKSKPTGQGCRFVFPLSLSFWDYIALSGLELTEIHYSCFLGVGINEDPHLTSSRFRILYVNTFSGWVWLSAKLGNRVVWDLSWGDTYMTTHPTWGTHNGLKWLLLSNLVSQWIYWVSNRSMGKGSVTGVEMTQWLLHQKNPSQCRCELQPRNSLLISAQLHNARISPGLLSWPLLA